MKRGFLEKLIERIRLVQPGDVQNYLVEIAREKGFLETIFNAILEGVIVTDPSGRIIYLNRAAAGFFGISVEASLGELLGHAVRGLDFEQLSAGGGVISRDLEVFYPENRHLNFYTVPLMSEDSPDEVVGHAIILRDITQYRRETQETIESERFSALTLLAAGVAHEIGNPLNSLDIHLQLMERRLRKLPSRSRGEFEESINVARQEVKRLDHIITQFLRAIRPQPLTLRPDSLNAIVEESVSFLQAEIRDRDILVEVDLDRSLPTLGVDRDQIKQAFYNIIRNAFQAMKTGGILRIRSGADETHQFISFADSGGGIAPENITRVFEPYFTTKQSGSGLGLLIVRRIVRAHGGEVIIESAPGQGLTVTIRLPSGDRRVRFLEQGSPNEAK
ncbi:PAS domain-containing protein [Terrimicrobium sacchariphilum]|uniref:histidine kinase n=1 Tax=Terrimicrobium sacchariphilum TaxID=690879 RepID=A0A146G900_TERSA|nr:ATP-binding protein [Terrimicrobium sacchariphilum]GAT34169.1 PAS domain-containing protein [Terrimicrobium sacchariphilum]